MTIYSYSDTARAVKMRLEALWTRTPLEFEGDSSFTKPADSPWVRATTLPSDGSPMGIGGRNVQSVGFVHLDVIGKRGLVASDYLGRLADEVAEIFRFFSTGGIHWSAPHPPRPIFSDPAYHIFKVLAPYTRQDGADREADMAVYAVATQTQSAHGFARGNFLRFSGSGWAKALADADDHLARGVVVNVRDSSRFDVAYLGSGLEVEVPGHGLGASGATVYLSQGVAGAGTSTAPTTGLSQVLGQVKDADRLILGTVQAQDVTP